MRFPARACAALTLVAGLAQAQGEPPRAETPKGWHGAAGIHIGIPTLVSGTVGLQNVIFDGKDERIATQFAVIEPGLGASRLSYGLLYTGVNATGWALRGTVLQQYYLEHATLVGFEVTYFKFLFLGPRFGFFWPVAGTIKKPTMTFDLGFMY